MNYKREILMKNIEGIVLSFKNKTKSISWKDSSAVKSPVALAWAKVWFPGSYMMSQQPSLAPVAGYSILF